MTALLNKTFCTSLFHPPFLYHPVFSHGFYLDYTTITYMEHTHINQYITASQTPNSCREV